MTPYRIFSFFALNIFIMPVILFGAFICYGKPAWLIKAAHLTQKEQEQWNMRRVYITADICTIGIAIGMEVVIIGTVMGLYSIMFLGSLLLALFIIGGSQFIDKSKFFRNNVKTEESTK